MEWIRHFLSELEIVQHKTEIFEDNQAAISIATSLSVSGNSRHVVVRYARVREAVTEKMRLSKLFTSGRGGGDSVHRHGAILEFFDWMRADGAMTVRFGERQCPGCGVQSVGAQSRAAAWCSCLF